MSTSATAILGEIPVYPGHLVTLAYIIVRTYPSLSIAEAPGRRRLAVEEDPAVPGAGGHPERAVELLRRLALGEEWDAVVAHADEVWARCDDQKNGGAGDSYYRARWKCGQDQADRVKPLLREALANWDQTVVEHVDLGPCIPEMPVDYGDPYGRLKFGFGSDRVQRAVEKLADRATPETVYAYLTEIG